MAIIPEVINNFNVYDDNSNKLVGVSGEVSLPNFETKTATLDGAGILGDMDIPVLGHFNNQEFEIPFRNLYGDIFSLYKKKSAAGLTLRGSIQVINTSTGAMEHKALKVSVKGFVTSLTTGKVKPGDPMGSSVKLNVHYIRIAVGGKEKIKLDKLNGVFKIDGVDQLAKINEHC